MKEVVLVRYGEIALKGLNRAYFEETLKNNIAKKLKKFII
jgi:thiamine biosynthesis protein ThiI